MVKEILRRLRKKSFLDCVGLCRKYAGLGVGRVFSRNEKVSTPTRSNHCPADLVLPEGGAGEASVIESPLLIIDAQCPQAEPGAFRNAEFVGIMRRFPGSKLAGFSESFTWGRGLETFAEDAAGFLQHYPEFSGRIGFLDADTRLKAKLAYVVFLSQGDLFCELFERQEIPFVMELYPGGTFEPYNAASDAKIRRVCASSQLQKVISTQPFTTRYLLKRKLCPPEKICEIFGGLTQIAKEAIKPRLFYGRDKATLDVCFVAMKYMDGGLNKGYDVFIDMAERVAAEAPEARFHIVGNWDASDVVDPDLAQRCTFYGARPQAFFPEFFQNMDAIVTPSRPFVLGTQFDGFPLGVDGAVCGTPLFVTDELKLNTAYASDEIEIIRPEPDMVADRILYYHNNYEALIELSLKCQARSRDFFDPEIQIAKRIQCFRDVMHDLYPGEDFLETKA